LQLYWQRQEYKQFVAVKARWLLYSLLYSARS
jgi:hypothetical protein